MTYTTQTYPQGYYHQHHYPHSPYYPYYPPYYYYPWFLYPFIYPWFNPHHREGWQQDGQRVDQSLYFTPAQEYEPAYPAPISYTEWHNSVPGR